VPDSASFDAFYRASRQRPHLCLFALTGQRVAIVLHHVLGLPLTEVAVEIVGPIGAVKARLSRERPALAQLLDVDLAEEGSHV
jgi:DNA-directed RNA polymerase specialized sigma24 family protein